MGERNVASSDAARVAKAESQLEEKCPTVRMSIAKAQSWIDRVAHSEDIDPPFVVQHQLPRRLLGVAVLDDHVIFVRHARPSQLTLLHELTHCIGHTNHGPSFQRRFVELVQRHISREHGEAFASLLTD
jgi:hypothetical protein